MKQKLKPIVQTVCIALCIFSLTLCCVIRPASQYSESERRELKQFPAFSWDALISGQFIAEFEEYAQDQFPLRDSWRQLKAFVSLSVFQEKDNNGLYETDGVLSKMEYPLNAASFSAASEKFRYLYEQHLKEANTTVYLSVIPDKNAFVAEPSGHLAMDYDAVYEQMKAENDFAQYIHIADLLSADDYYATDTHWRQECITDVAARIAETMGADITTDYTEETLDHPFYGVYAGQSALNVPPDTLRYLTSDVLNGCAVYDHENNREIAIYDMEKAVDKDPYEIFLSGPLSLITIDNPSATSDKDLVVFRDSFGSSLVPLLAPGYRRITVVDIRYLPSTVLDRYVTFDNADVLFIYSTLVLNNSNTLK